MALADRPDHRRSAACDFTGVLRIPRSARSKRSSRKKGDVSHGMCPIDLLATLAGELLAQRDGVPVKQEVVVEETKPSAAALGWLASSLPPVLPAFVKTETLDSVSAIRCDGRRSPATTTAESGPPDPMNLDLKPFALVSSDSSSETMPAKKLSSGGTSHLRTMNSAFKRRKLVRRYSPTATPEVAAPVTDMVPYHSRSEVKLCIESFEVPELVVEIAENATVGSLKRAVMEAISAIIGGGLHVGVLVHGKKVGDDEKTLRQAGIACGDDSVGHIGFSLEPEYSALPSGDVAPGPADPEPTGGELLVVAASRSVLTSQGKHHDGDRVSVHSPTGVAVSSPDKTTTTSADSRAVVPFLPDSLAVIPAVRKCKRTDHGQRRIRRPFSVAEVDALVQAVEKLGTGRWRDVKNRAFEHAKHRTYVDLKDKWKTLVHTASISPQQRRGEPVPQDLLDRVLSAQAYWSQQQPRFQPARSSEPCFLSPFSP